MSAIFEACRERGMADGIRLIREIEAAADEVARLVTLAYGEPCRVDFLQEHAVVMIRMRRAA